MMTDTRDRVALDDHRAPSAGVPLLEMVQPMPGFPFLRHFALVQVDETGLLCELRSVEDPATSFLVAPPTTFFPDYVAVVDEALVDGLEAESVDDLLMVAVVTVGADLASSTMNLAAPVLIDTRSRRAQQVVLEDTSLPLAAPLIPA